MKQDLRGFVQAYGDRFPEEVIRVSDPVDLKYDIMALVLEYEKRRRSPILIFDNVKGHKMSVICNVLAARSRLATALGVGESALSEEYGRRIEEYIEPRVVKDPPFQQVVMTGEDADLGLLPVPTFFPGDAGPYITAGMMVARHPDTGVITEGFHRCQVKGPRRIGTTLHSRRRMFEYQRLYEERGRDMPAAICIGLHPIMAMGSLTYPSPEVSKFQVCGGLFGEPMQVARCSTIDLLVPAWSEIVIEGEFLAGVREPEGPFGEFTGYVSEKTTRHVFNVKAISMREDAWFQSIASSKAGDHVGTGSALREARVLRALRKTIPAVQAVHFPSFGCGGFIAFISMRQSRPGEAKQAISIALGAEHYLKTVVIVDEDVDVFDESDVLWAIATRFQADRDLVVVSGSMGALMDPSASEDGATAKMGIDATKPVGEPYAEKLVMDTGAMARARELIASLSSRSPVPRAG